MIPSGETKTPSVEILHPELRHMVKMLAGSSDTPLFKIEYFLDIFVKHQSKLEFGMGNSVNFPIDVKNQQVDLPYNV